MFNYHKPPPLPSDEESIQNGKQIGKFDIDILPDDANVKVYTYWRGFRPSDFKKFQNHKVLDLLKKIYNDLKPNEFAKKPRFREFFNDKSNQSTIDKITIKKKYPKGTQFLAYLQLQIILKPYNFDKGELFFRYTNYAFPDNLPESFKGDNLYLLLQELNNLLKNNEYLLK